MTPIIRIENLHFTYNPETASPVKALDGIDLSIEAGEYLVILGHNGSGKSTLAKHLNGLLLPTEGDVWVKEWNTRDLAQMRAIRSTVGMVFQTPDNQIVATIVEEDVAFGPENLGVPRQEILRRVDWSLEQVRMLPFRHRPPHLLSGGQKQRVAIAGMLAMQPEVLVLDESTAMLDPRGREEVLEVARRLHREQGTTIVAITHFMEEAVHADRVVVLDQGRIALEGTPRELFAQAERLHQLQMALPQITLLAASLHRRHPAFPQALLTPHEFVRAFGQMVDPAPTGELTASAANTPALAPGLPEEAERPRGEPLIRLANLGHDYMHDTPLAVQAVHDVNLTVYAGEILGIIGHTGSGKSTIVQHMNGLLRPHRGAAWVLGRDMTDTDSDMREIRRRVGLVFQQPEAQLFERYVGDDIAFGPRNLKLSREAIRERVRTAMHGVGLDFDLFKDRMTFGLSGGQKRRVALAGVLALQPEVLVLDEPTAGLDPVGRRQLLDLILNLHTEGVTLVIISHNMQELAEVCHRLVVIADGTTVMQGSPAQIYSQSHRLREMGLGVPDVTAVLEQLQDAGLLSGDVQGIHTVEDAARFLGEALHAKL